MKPPDLDLRLVLDTTPALICSGRPDSGVDYVNRRWLDEVGASPDALDGWGWTDFIYPDDLQDLLHRWRASMDSGEPAVSEARVRRATGDYRWMLHRVQPVRDEHGTVVRWIGSSLDIEDLRRAEGALRSTERELRTILETIPAFVWTARPDGALDFITGRFFAQTGLRKNETLLWEWTTVLHPEDRERVVQDWRDAIAAGRAPDQEMRIRSRDGTYRWFLASAAPLRDDEGAILRWYGTFTDIDVRKRAEQELQKLKDQLDKENIALRDEISQTSMFEEIVGSSGALRRVLMLVGKVAGTDSTVLITGETGTGKELIARAIHKRSPRAARPFVPVSCGAISPSLIASELFGHEKGAFTGALQRHLGRFEMAEGGTIFLDEVGELPYEIQVALLRVLQERTFERVGGSQSVPVDVRVIAATNRDLDKAIAKGAFRTDLYYRLSVFPVHVPPLRDRAEDIPLLVEYLTHRYAAKVGKRVTGVNRRTMDLLRSYDWPGNVRELQNVIQRAVILSEGMLAVDEAWFARAATPATGGVHRLGRLSSREEMERIESALARSHGRVAGPDGAAAELGIPRSTLESKIRSLHIDKHRFKTG
jgi:formate hydrogenlyase transcriptional activator